MAVEGAGKHMTEYALQFSVKAEYIGFMAATDTVNCGRKFMTGECIMRAYTDFFRHYFNWRGRTGRKGFWLFMLINAIIVLLLQLLDRAIATSILGFTRQEVSESGGVYILTFIYLLLTLIPGITLLIRRLHDIDKSGWWWLLSFIPVLGSLILLIFSCLKSKEDNRFGPKPQEGYTS